MVAAELIPKQQIVPYAPWEIRRANLDSEPIQAIVNHLNITGKLPLQPRHFPGQESLFHENKRVDKAMYCACGCQRRSEFAVWTAARWNWSRVTPWSEFAAMGVTIALASLATWIAVSL